MSNISHFAEKSGIVQCNTPWGRWWQTVYEVFIEVNLPEGSTKTDVDVRIRPKFLEIIIKNQSIIKGDLYQPVIADETVWTIEERKLLHIQLSKVDPMSETRMWTSLLQGNQFAPDPWTLKEMETKVDLEKFQIENPGFDFSDAKLSKSQ